MTCKVLKPFKLETARKVVELPQGKLVNLPNDSAIALIQGGKVAPVDAAIRIYSEVLGEHIWLVDTYRQLEKLRANGVTESIYTKEEIQKLRGMEADELKAIHDVKKVFELSYIDDVRQRTTETEVATHG